MASNMTIHWVSFIWIMGMVYRLVYRGLRLMEHHRWLMVYNSRFMKDDRRRLYNDAWPMNYDIRMVHYDIWTMVNCGWRMVDYRWSMHYEMVLFVSFGCFRLLFGMVTCMFTWMVTFLVRFFRMFLHRRIFGEKTKKIYKIHKRNIQILLHMRSCTSLF